MLFSFSITSVLVPTFILLLKHLFEKPLLKLMMILSLCLAVSFPAAVLVSPPYKTNPPIRATRLLTVTAETFYLYSIQGYIYHLGVFYFFILGLLCNWRFSLHPGTLSSPFLVSHNTVSN